MLHIVSSKLRTSHLALLLVAAGLLLPATSHAQQKRSGPLQLVPANVDWVVKIDQPRKVVETLYGHEIAQEWLKLDLVSNLFDTTNFRRLLQIKGFFEKKLGVGGLDLLERLTGNGVVLGVRTNDKPGRALVIIQGKDEALLRQFFDLAASVAEQELARQENKEKLTPQKFGAHDGYRFGSVCAVVAGPNLILASDSVTLQSSLNLIGKKKRAGSIAQNPHFKEATTLLPAQPLAWSWVDMQSVRKIENFKTGLDAASMDPNALFVFGGLLDMMQRSPMVVTSLRMDGKNLVVENRMPVGRKGMEGKEALYVPSEGKGTLPLLQPPRTLASISHYLDLKAFWENRAKLLNMAQLKPLEDFDVNSAKFLGGTKFSTLLQQSGPHQRIVVAQPLKTPYAIKPETPVPAFALVQEIRDPAFAGTMNKLLRTGGLLLSFQFKLRIAEEKHGPCTVIAYYFNENKPLEGDSSYLRLNYSPAFVVVNNHLVISSTAELAHDLVDELIKESKEEPRKTEPAPSSTTTEIALFAKGGAGALQSAREQLIAQAILNQAQPPEAARKQIDSLIGFVEKLGSLRIEVQYGQEDFRHTIRWQYK